MIPLSLFRPGVARSIDTITVRAAARLLAAVVLFCVALGATSRGAEVPAAGDPAGAVTDGTVPPADGSVGADAPADTPSATEPTSADNSSATALELPELPVTDNRLARIAELSDVGEKFWSRGEHEAAERSFADALSLDVPPAAKRDLLLRMVDIYEKGDDPVRAVAVMEKILQTFPNDPEAPQFVMRLGLLYRQTGAYGAATARFYQVLNSTMRPSSDHLDVRRRLATKARLEIADTYMMQGNLEEARKFYGLLQLLDLESTDRERVQFRSAQLQHELKLWQPAERELGAFLQAYPTSAYAPEARYLRAKALKELGRKDEAVQEVIALLRSQDESDAKRSRTVAYWKRRTGNELANTFYEQGDFLGALALYQALARAGDEPAWQWPAVYQVGLCFERLHLPQRAQEAYKVIVTPDPPLPPGPPLPETLIALQGMAKWRLEHLDWISQFEAKLQTLTAGKPAGTS